MIEGKKVLGLIPARGGSKGVPKKNIRLLGGKPLLAWTAEAAYNSRYLDRVILSSDSEEIIAVGRQWHLDAPFVRPAELAQDTSTGVEVTLHALGQCPGYDYLVLLQPTSPLRTGADIDACIELCHSSGAETTFSACEATESPFWMYTLNIHGRVEPLLKTGYAAKRRQELPAVYIPNGAVYVVRTELFLANPRYYAEDTCITLMPRERSVDLDTEFDFTYLEALISAR